MWSQTPEEGRKYPGRSPRPILKRVIPSQKSEQCIITIHIMRMPSRVRQQAASLMTPELMLIRSHQPNKQPQNIGISRGSRAGPQTPTGETILRFLPWTQDFMTCGTHSRAGTATAEGTQAEGGRVGWGLVGVGYRVGRRKRRHQCHGGGKV